MSDEEPILRVEGLKKYYDTSAGFIDNLFGESAQVKAVDGIDFELYPGETLGVVGESGCGKSTLAQSLLRLIEPTDGSVYYRQQNDDGTSREIDLLELSSSQLRDLRRDLQYIFQDPFASLNPRLTVGDIIGEPLDIHGLATGEDRQERIYKLLEIVGLNPSHTHRYPHEFSGGQRQRIGIARALAVDPEVIVCDEPVSALDVSVQAQILNLLEDLQDQFGLSYIFIAHDLSVVEHISDRIAVMYLGQFAEVGSTDEVFNPPYHPYAEALLSAIPEPDPLWEGQQILLPGTVPSPINPPSGCSFHTRCPRVIPPQEFDLTQQEWRSILDFKLRLRGAEDVDAVTAVEGEDSDDELVDPTEVDRNELGRLVRLEFGFPETLDDPDAEHIISQVIDFLFTEDVEGAREMVEEAFVTPCEQDEPGLIGVDETHQISCLLFDDRFDNVLAEQDIESVGSAAADD